MFTPSREQGKREKKGKMAKRGSKRGRERAEKKEKARLIVTTVYLKYD